jgi:hypothetical protein
MESDLNNLLQKLENANNAVPAEFNIHNDPSTDLQPTSVVPPSQPQPQTQQQPQPQTQSQPQPQPQSQHSPHLSHLSPQPGSINPHSPASTNSPSHLHSPNPTMLPPSQFNSPSSFDLNNSMIDLQPSYTHIPFNDTNFHNQTNPIPPSFTLMPNNMPNCIPPNMGNNMYNTIPNSTSETISNNAIALVNNLSYDPLGDFKHHQLQSTIFNICIQNLPEKATLIQNITKVHKTYSQEFYIITWNELMNNIDYIYKIIQDPSQIQSDSLGNIHSILCHIFILLAFSHQLNHRPQSSYPSDFRFPGIDQYLLAEYLFHLTKENISVTHIQSALLLGLYAANLSRYNTVYSFLGVAVRSAVSLNLHRKRHFINSSDPDVRSFQEISKRLWWSVFVIEIIWATKTVHFQYTDTDVDLPSENIYNMGESNFQLKLLEDNVHLTKYVAKFIRLIYGPNIRTFSINYINTNQFNQTMLITNIIQSFQDLITNVEVPVLSEYRNCDVVTPEGSRTIANLILRYHQSIILIIKPILPLLYDSSLQHVIEKNLETIELIISKGLYAACATVEIISKLYSTERMFLLGFWDSQHLFCAILLLIISRVEGTHFRSLDKGIALLRFMAHNRNTNAINCVGKLFKIKEILGFHGINLDLSETRLDFPLEKVRDHLIREMLPYLADEFTDGLEPLSNPMKFTKMKDFDEQTKNNLASLMHQIQQFDY